MSVHPLHPDWGPAEIRRDGGPKLNPAAVLGLMRDTPSAKCRRAYRAACTHWQRVKDDPTKTAAEKHVECLSAGFAEIGAKTACIA